MAEEVALGLAEYYLCVCHVSCDSKVSLRHITSGPLPPILIIHSKDHANLWGKKYQVHFIQSLSAFDNVVILEFIKGQNKKNPFNVKTTPSRI